MSVDATLASDRLAAKPLGQPRLSIVIVSWNTRSYLVPCLRSIFESDLRSPLEVIVVDNNSTDNTQAIVRSLYPAVRLLENECNVGFARATNQGVQEAQGDYALLLNADTVVNGPSLQAMVDFMQQAPEAAAVGGTLINPDGSFQGAYARFSSFLQEALIALGIGDRLWSGYPSHHRSSRTEAVDWISAACLLVRREAFLRVGCLDEEYVMYSEEVDLQYRLKQAGWKVYYLPAAHTVHWGGGSQSRLRRRRAVYRGKLLFYRKNIGVLSYWALRLILALICLAKFVLWVAVAAVPTYRRRAVAEANSHFEVLKLCRDCGRSTDSCSL